nr:hypothetical protein [Candidatus Sigynarchaeum springense]
MKKEGIASHDFDDVTPGSNICHCFCVQFGSAGSYTKAIVARMHDANHAFR